MFEHGGSDLHSCARENQKTSSASIKIEMSEAKLHSSPDSNMLIQQENQ
jgi:hypothetical protein